MLILCVCVTLSSLLYTKNHNQIPCAQQPSVVAVWGSLSFAYCVIYKWVLEGFREDERMRWMDLV